MRDEASEPFSHIEELELRPKIHKTIGGWSSRESHDAFYLGTNFHESLEAFGLMILERREFIDHNRVKGKRKSGFFNEPGEVLPVDDGDVCALKKRGFSLCWRSDGDRISQHGEVIPFLDLGWPRFSCDSKWGYD